MPSQSNIRDARAELQKMQAEMADDRALGLFSRELQSRITETRKLLADMGKEYGKHQDDLRKKQKETQEETKKQNKLLKEQSAEEQRLNRMRIAGVAAGVLAYRTLASSVRSLRQAGMENTIEANRQEVAYTLLGREIAGIFLPATQASTNASLSAAKALSNLSEDGQNVVMVLSYATAGLVTFTTAQIAATAAGIRLTGVLSVMARWLPLIGLAAGGIVALGAIFLSTEEGAAMLNSRLEDMVDLLNEVGKKAEAMKRMTWTEWLGVKGFELLESVGILKKGVGDMAIGAIADIQEREGRTKKPGGNAGKKPTPGRFQFEGVSDAFERVQLAAAKTLDTQKGTPEKQLEVTEEMQKEIQKIHDVVLNAALRAIGAKRDF